MKKITFIILVAISVVSMSWASTLKDFGRSMSYFYIAPSENAFKMFQKDADDYQKEILTIGRGKDILLSVMIARISQKYNWPINSNAFGERAKEIIIGKSNLAKYISDDSMVDASKLDIWWVSFFATGDNSYLEKIFKYAGEPSEKEHGTINLVYSAASWSFKANCRQHEKVKLFAEEKQKNGSYSESKMKYLQECLSYANKK